VTAATALSPPLTAKNISEPWTSPAQNPRTGTKAHAAHTARTTSPAQNPRTGTKAHAAHTARTTSPAQNPRTDWSHRQSAARWMMRACVRLPWHFPFMTGLGRADTPHDWHALGKHNYFYRMNHELSGIYISNSVMIGGGRASMIGGGCARQRPAVLSADLI